MVIIMMQIIIENRSMLIEYWIDVQKFINVFSKKQLSKC